MSRLEPDVRKKIEEFIRGFYNEDELKAYILKWELMKGERIVLCVKSAIVGDFHGEVWNDYQNILKEKYGRRHMLTQEQYNAFNYNFIEWAREFKAKLDEVINS